MGRKRYSTMDIHELVRLKRSGVVNAEIVRLLGCDRKTVRKYVKWAGEQGLLDGPLRTAEAMHAMLEATVPQQVPAQQESSVAEYGDEIRAMRKDKVEMAAITARLQERHHKPISYEAVRRYVRKIEPLEPDACVRMEVPPGTEAQVDFGYAGLTVDEEGQVRKTWVFVMQLSWSRYMFALLVYSQDIRTWLECHRRAFEFFGGVPDRIVLDNLRAAITKACVDDPLVQRSYREFAEHYGFLIDPNPPARPNLKGKTEQGAVHYVKRNFMAGRGVEPTAVLNERLVDWLVDVAGARLHGTTKKVPLTQFLEVEKGLLRPLPGSPYDMGVWAERLLYRDCYVTYDHAYYSAPYRLVGQTLRVRDGTRTVRLYTTDYQLVATHDRATEPGQRRTCLEHLPPEKVAGITITRDACRLRAAAIGVCTEQVVETLLASRPVDKLRAAGRLLDLAETYSPERVERACARALAFDDPAYLTVKNILKNGQDDLPLPGAPPAPTPRQMAFTFAREAVEHAAAFFGAFS